MIVADPLIELLAIKLYEHDHDRYPPVSVYPWSLASEADREIYRQVARGGYAYGRGPDDKEEISL